MCGIAGVIQNSLHDRIPVVEKMLSRIAYRGPDESGIYHSEKATIGNVRLSIIDIASGQQPLSDSSGRFWIVFNGEIFNYIELKQELEEKGFQFKTLSDTEVVVQLYAYYGKSFVKKLNGQFAIAIWDKQNEELFLARDRVGIRPLFYYHSGNDFVFGSEIKAILEFPGIEAAFSHQALSQVFTYWTSLSPNTAFKNIFELPPAHILSLSGGNIKIEKYWELPFGKTGLSRSVGEASEEFRELFSRAVNIQLRADVEVGAYLSGGLDSSITVSAIKEFNLDILNTFSIGFEEAEFNESDFQNEAASFFQTKHASININSREIARSFPEVIYHAETPMLRTAPVPMYLLSKLVREQGIKVVITGEGADEFFGGYNIFKEMQIRRFWATSPESLIRPLLLKRLYPYLPHIRNASPRMLKMFFNYKLEDTGNPYYSHLIRWNNTGHILDHTSEDFKHNLNGQSNLSHLDSMLPNDFAQFDPLSKAQWIESTVFMSGYLLSSQGDRMAMANSVEGRYPFLDHHVIEFAASLPENQRIRGMNEKYLLKKAMKDKIPESILSRSKQAYRAPVRTVFLDEKAPPYVKDFLSADYTKKVGVFNPEKLASLLKKMNSSNSTNELDNMSLTAILSTHLLHHQFIENNKNDGFKLSKLQVIRDI